jgi:hypothetical protein
MSAGPRLLPELLPPTASLTILRYRRWHAAGRLVRHGRQCILRLQRTWPWAAELVAAFARLRALSARC